MKASGWLLIVALIAVVGIGGFAWYRFEGAPPGLEAPDAELVIGRAGVKVDLHATDVGSGLRSLHVAITQPGSAEQTLLDESYPGNLLSGGTRSEQASSLQLDPTALGALKGPATLSISVRDWSWRGALAGNETRRDLPLRVDLDPPRIEVTSGISGITYVRQGGSGSVAYRVSEATARDGVRVGTVEYRGFPRKGVGANERIALFAVPTDVDAKAPVRVFAEDAAGNSSEAGWSVVVQPYVQPEGKVQLSDAFLTQVVPRLAPQTAAGSPDSAFQDVNTRVRAENEKRIRELIADSAPEPLFAGNLHQLANSKVTSRFGEKRIYMVDGRELSRAVHYGYDLASLSGAPVTAAAAGRVLYAGDLGIYGNCVVLDHGLGLASIYGHLSRIDVEANARVEADQRLGLTGATGLAGGDHLHFATLVGNTYVDPIEWWDAKWVTDHVAPNLSPPASELTPRRRAALRAALLAWYRVHRRDLPWRRTRDPYAIWISEAMLQQTRVETVIPYYQRFLGRFPDVAALATADLDEVTALWAGLGYYSRARNLHRAARIVMERHEGRLPDDVDALRELPGVGRYTAGALASIAFDRPAPIVDGNVARVLARLLAIDGDLRSPANQERLWSEAETLARGEDPGALNQGLMELGATVCTPRAPRCAACPWTRHCAAHAQGRAEELPVRSRPTQVRRVDAVAAFLERHDRVLAVQRPQRGLLGGLWELPGGDLRDGEAPARALERALRDGLGLAVSQPESIGTIEHAFTHRLLRVHVYRGAVGMGRVRRTGWDAHRWVSRSALVELPLGGPTRKALAHLAQSTAQNPKG